MVVLVTVDFFVDLWVFSKFLKSFLSHFLMALVSDESVTGAVEEGHQDLLIAKHGQLDGFSDVSPLPFVE